MVAGRRCHSATMASAAAAEPFKGLPAKKVDGRRFKVGIVYARWNLKITAALVEGARYARRRGAAPRSLRQRLTPRRQADAVGPALRGGDSCRKALLEAGTLPENITIHEVPGSFELPFAASRIVASTVASIPPT